MFMKNLYDEIRAAEARYYAAELIVLFVLGVAIGAATGWFLWG